MLSVRTVLPLKPSKKAASASSRIKNKILNTSSFFKVSLKSNNKALAVALTLQKERCRQQEKELVFFQKQVEALCFELATRKYKHRKLLLILKNLHSSTLSSLDEVVNLYSDSDLPKLSKEVRPLSNDIDKENIAVGSLADQLLPQPDPPEARFCPVPTVTVEPPEKHACADMLQFTDTDNDNTNAEKRRSSQCETGASRPSSSLREDGDRQQTACSQSRFDLKSILGLHHSQTPSDASACEQTEPALSNTAPSLPPSPPPPPPSSGSMTETHAEQATGKQEKTSLLSTTMEMTVSNPTEIVTVAKKRGRPRKQKDKKEEQAENAAENPQVKKSAAASVSNEVQNATTAEPLLQKDAHAQKEVKLPEVIDGPSLKTTCKSNGASRIPKLIMSDSAKNPKMPKEKSKSREPPAKSKTQSRDVALPDLDDFFTDPVNKCSKAGGNVQEVPAEEDNAAEVEEERRSRITCRGQRTKSRVTETFGEFPSPPPDFRNEVVEEADGNDEACENKEQPLLCADESPHTDMDNPDKKTQKKMKSKGLSSKCRGTFVVSPSLSPENEKSIRVFNEEEEGGNDKACKNKELPLSCVDESPHTDMDNPDKKTQKKMKSKGLTSKCRGTFVVSPSLSPENEKSIRVLNEEEEGGNDKACKNKELPLSCVDGAPRIDMDNPDKKTQKKMKSKGLTSRCRATFVLSPLLSPQNDKSIHVRDEVGGEEEEGNDEVRKNKELPLFCAGEVPPKDMENPDRETQRETKSLKGPTWRCRGTFVVSDTIDGTSPNRLSTEVYAAERDLRSFSARSSTCEIQEPATVIDESVVSGGHSEWSPPRSSEGTQSSSKRPWVATLDPETPREHPSDADEHAARPQDLDFPSDTVFQKPKKARREETGRSNKKKTSRKEERADPLKERTKKKKIVSSKKGMKSKDEGCNFGEYIDSLPLGSIDDPDGNKQQSEDLDTRLNEKDDTFDNFFSSRTYEDALKRESNVTRRRNTSKQNTPAGSGHLRESFGEYRVKSPDGVSLQKKKRKSSVSWAHAGQNVWELLADEMPPWLGCDVSRADTEVGSPRRETSGQHPSIQQSVLTAENSPAGRVLTSLTNIITTPDKGTTTGRSRRAKGPVRYKEPSLNSKLRRGDKHADDTFLSSPIFKDGKKAKKKRTHKTGANPKMDKSLSSD